MIKLYASVCLLVCMFVYFLQSLDLLCLGIMKRKITKCLCASNTSKCVVFISTNIFHPRTFTHIHLLIVVITASDMDDEMMMRNAGHIGESCVCVLCVCFMCVYVCVCVCPVWYM